MLVERVRSRRIRMALDLDVDVAVVGLQLVDEDGQALLGFRREFGTVQRKLDRIIRQDYGVQEFALGQFAGGGGALQSILRGLVELAEPCVVLVQLGLRGFHFGIQNGYALVHVVFTRAAAERESNDG